MSMLITGSSGFVGKNIVPYLDKLDILTPSRVELNLTDYNSVMDYFAHYKPQKVLHLAAACGGIGLNKKSPADLTHLNLKMLVHIFDAIKKYNVEYFYGAGSVCSYPYLCPIPFNEKDIWSGRPEKTNKGYGESKRMMITLFQEYKKQYGLKGAVLIPVNLFGPQDHFDLNNSHVIPALINKFVDAVNNNKDVVKCWGTGNSTREFLFIDDLCRAFKIAIENNLNTLKPINIGTGRDISIKDLAFLIGQLTEFTGEIIFTGEVSDGQPKRMLDVSRAKELLNFEASVDLEDGLKKTIEWYESQEEKHGYD